MKTKRYLNLQIKRGLKHLPSILAITLLLAVCISLACALIITQNNENESQKKIKIGITGDLSQTYLGIGITAIETMDTSRFSIEFITMDEEQAQKDVRAGNLSGYIRIPDGFVESIVKMDNIPIVYVTSDSPTGFGSILMNEVAKTISDTVAETQKGIYGMQKISKEYKKTENYKENTDKINIEYIETVLNRTSVFETEYLGMSDGVSMGAYFVCGGVMMFLLLWGITCNSYLYKKDRSMEKLLVSKGSSVFSQVICEYLSFIFITVMVFMLFAFTTGLALQNIKIGITEIDSVYPSDFISYIIKILPVILMITSVHFLLYECISGYVGVILIQFIFAIGTGYICGCLYPSYYFPESIQKVSSFLPTGLGVTYMRQSISGTLSLKSIIGVILFTVVFLALSVVFRAYRIGGKE